MSYNKWCLVLFFVTLFQNIVSNEYRAPHAVLYFPSSTPSPTHARGHHRNQSDYAALFSQARQLPSQIRYKSLSTYTKEDFACLVTCQAMDVDTAYQQCHWYKYPAFREYLRTSSDHEQRIRALLKEKKQKYEMGLSELWGHISGNYAFGLKRILMDEIFSIESHAREEQQKQQQAYYAQRDAQVLLHKNNAHSVNNHEYRVHNPSTHTVLPEYCAARAHALTQMQADSTRRIMYSPKIDVSLLACATQYGISEENLAEIAMNLYEHQLHTEFVTQLTAAAELAGVYKDGESYTVFLDALGHGIAIGMEANQLQQPEMATTWANCGWQLLEIIEGIGEGLVQCIQNNVDMLLHPIHTLTHVVHGLKTVTGCFLRAIGTAIRWDLMMERGEEIFVAQEMDDIATQIVVCGTLCAEKLATMPPRDIAKQVTAVAADIVLVPKMLSFGSTLCSRVAPLAEEAIVVLRDHLSNINNAIACTIEAVRAESPIVQTTEGMLMRMSEDLRKVGGSVGEVIKDSRLALEAVHAEYMAQLETELKILRLTCDNKIKDVARFGHKYLKPQYEHILGIDLSFTRRGFADIGGFHHDLNQTVEMTNIIKFANKAIHENGCYSADLVYIGEIIKPYATFFPSDWSRKKVIDKIYEAYENFVKSGAQLAEKGGKYVVDTTTHEGIKIRMYIKKNGLIVTAFPVLK